MPTCLSPYVTSNELNLLTDRTKRASVYELFKTNRKHWKGKTVLWAEWAVYVMLCLCSYNNKDKHSMTKKQFQFRVFTVYSEPLLLWIKAGKWVTKMNWWKHYMPKLETDFQELPIHKRALKNIFSNQCSHTKHYVLPVLANRDETSSISVSALLKKKSTFANWKQKTSD